MRSTHDHFADRRLRRRPGHEHAAVGERGLVSSRQVSASRVIAAPPGRIFDLLADPVMHPRIDGSGTVQAVLPGAPPRLKLGSRFGMDMKLGGSYKITNTVVEYEADHVIAWRHLIGHRWRWQLEKSGQDATVVTETFDWSTAHLPVIISLSPFPRRNRQAIERSLERLADLAKQGAGDGWRPLMG
jgi:uncharacterized protein YndB with AHSA1/START domain